MEMQVTFPHHPLPHHTVIIHRFCNAPYDLEMILEIIESVEKQLDEISKNPSVKKYEQFIRKNSQTLHIKHYLNLFGETLVDLIDRQTDIRALSKEEFRHLLKFLVAFSKTNPLLCS